jgi:hypothetical protein
MTRISKALSRAYAWLAEDPFNSVLMLTTGAGVVGGIIGGVTGVILCKVVG